MTLIADVARTESTLQSVAWVVDGSVVDRQSIDGNSATVDLTHSFEETGPKEVSAVVYDSMGDRGSDTHTVVVTPEPAAGPVGDSSDSLCHEPSGLCGNGADYIYTEDGVTTIIDTNGKPGIQLATGGGGIADYGNNLARLDATRTPEDGGLKVDAGKLSDITVEKYRVDNKSSDDNANNAEVSDSNKDSSGTGDDNNDGNSVSSSGDLANAISGDSEDDNSVNSSGDLANAISGDNDDGDNDNSGNSGDDDSDGGILGGILGGDDDGESDSGGNDDDDSGGGILGGLL
jgi:hypothetical protein